jgi:hypothetical protein
MKAAVDDTVEWRPGGKRVAEGEIGVDDADTAALLRARKPVLKKKTRDDSKTGVERASRVSSGVGVAVVVVTDDGAVVAVVVPHITTRRKFGIAAVALPLMTIAPRTGPLDVGGGSRGWRTSLRGETTNTSAPH